MGAHLLILPALFAAICSVFIIVQSCYTKWKLNSKWRQKREAAKISLVNILQTANNQFLQSRWHAKAHSLPELGARPTEITIEGVPCCACNCKRKKEILVGPKKDSDNPVVKFDPLPCYEDLYGGAAGCDAVFSFASENELSPCSPCPPPAYHWLQLQETRSVAIQTSDGVDQEERHQHQSTMPTVNQNLAQHLHNSQSETGRRNSSAVLYL